MKLPFPENAFGILKYFNFSNWIYLYNRLYDILNNKITKNKSKLINKIVIKIKFHNFYDYSEQGTHLSFQSS
jgi:hypothetical protein